MKLNNVEINFIKIAYPEKYEILIRLMKNAKDETNFFEALDNAVIFYHENMMPITEE